MRAEPFKSEAEECRRQAVTAFLGKPESDFLLRVARMFDELAQEAPQVAPSAN